MNPFLRLVALGVAVAGLSWTSPTRAAETGTLVAAEYFFDADPGEGRGFALPAQDGAWDSADELLDVTITLPNDLLVGFHRLSFRMLSSSNVWSVPHTEWITVTGPQAIARAEYFVDSDPGPGHGTPLPARDGALSSAIEELKLEAVDVSALESGPHQLFIRAADDAGRWGPAWQSTFQVAPPVTLVAAEWTTNALSGPGSGHPLVPADGAWDEAEETFAAPANAAEVGADCAMYTLYVRAQDSLGRWSTLPGQFWSDTDGTWDFDPAKGWDLAATARLQIACDLEGALEGDLDSSGQLTPSDWVQVGRFVAGLDPVQGFTSFMRADCAPRGTLGDGRLTVADWIQAGRYVAGLDPQTGSGGPAQALGNSPARSAALASFDSRTLTVGQAMGAPGSSVEVPILLEGEGNENAAGFSVRFDPRRLSFESATPGAGAPGILLLVNDRAATSGQVGIALVDRAGNAWTAGQREIIRLRFRATEETGEARVTFTDAPVLREVATAHAERLATRFEAGAVVVAAPARWLRVRPSGMTGIQLELVVDAGSAWEIQASEDLVHWETVDRPTPKNGRILWSDPDRGMRERRFYRVLSR